MNPSHGEEAVVVSEQRAFVRMEDLVFDQLLSLIAKGELLPGARLAVAEFTARFGTSATPVRMAISRLNEMGLVEIVPHRGARVVKMSVAEIKELYEVRRILEGGAAKIAAQQITEQGVASLEMVWNDFRDAVLVGDINRSYQLDVEFFSILFSFCKNHELNAIIERIGQRLRLYKMLWFSTVIRNEKELHTLKPAIINACRAGSGIDAEDAMRAFLTRAEGQLIQLVGTTMLSP